jgi:carbon-monoxide dehydrogenase large subunit
MTSHWMGVRVGRQEDRRLLTGTGRYTDDVQLPGMLHLAVLRSPHSHAAIVDLDPSAARRLPGVVAVYTAADLPASLPPIPMRLGVHAALEPYLQYPLAQQVVRYVGEPIAVAVAESRYRAEDALDHIAVQYAALPPVTDVLTASQPDAPRLFPESSGNTVLTLHQEIGTVEHALRDADLILEERLETQRHTGMPLETRGLVANYEAGRDQLTVWGMTKVPHINRAVLATMLGMPEHRIHCMASDVGGGFGVRGELYPEDVLVCYIARHLGRPVKWIEDRREHFLAANHSRQQVHEVTIGVRQDGTIVALRDTLYCDMGGYIRTHGVLVPMNTALLLPGPYKIPHYAYTLHAVLTSKTPVGTYRAPGGYEATFVRERLLDLVAERLRLDAAELRRRNLVQPADMPYDVGTRALDRATVYDSGDFPRTLQRTLEAVGYPAFRARQRLWWSQGRYRGIGLAVYPEKSGLGPFEGARVRLDGSGLVVVSTGAAPMGQGIETILGQIAAEVLHVAPETITVRCGDTEAMPHGVGTFASRTTVMAGSAVHRAAMTLRQRLCRLAAEHLEAAAEDIVLDNGHARVKGSPQTTVSFRQLAALASPARRHETSQTAVDVTEYFQSTQPTYATGVAAVEVEVDIDTASVTVLRGVVGYDLGRAINPLLAEGQIVGGAVRGIGGALLEELCYDSSGQLLTASFMDYLIPTAAEVPNIEALVLEDTPSSLNPLGVKGAGEGGIVGMGGAVANAVADALRPLGVRLTQLPLSPSVVHAAIRRAAHQA